MRRYTILVPEVGDPSHMACGFDVVDEAGRVADGLGFDELLGQVVSLCHPRLDGSPQYRMQTPAEWAAQRNARLTARAAPLGDDPPVAEDDIPF